MFFLFNIRADNQGALLLVDTAQIKQISLLNKGMHAIRAGWHDVTGIENGDRVRFELLDKAPAVLNEQIVVYRQVFHNSLSGEQSTAKLYLKSLKHQCSNISLINYSSSMHLRLKTSGWRDEGEEEVLQISVGK